MNDKNIDSDAYRTFQLMNEIEEGDAVSQRELARRLGIAVGLVNSCLKNFVAKGYVRVKTFPRNRYAYLLTPKGLTEKSRLAYQHLSYFAGLYTTTRRDFLELFSGLSASGVTAVAFVGVDEVAEIAYLSLREVGIELAGVYDRVRVGESFLDYEILPIGTIQGQIVICSLKRRAELTDELTSLGISPTAVHMPNMESL